MTIPCFIIGHVFKKIRTKNVLDRPRKYVRENGRLVYQVLPLSGMKYYETEPDLTKEPISVGVIDIFMCEKCGKSRKIES